MGCLDGYFHTALGLKSFALGWSTWIHLLMSPRVIFLGDSMVLQPLENRFFHTTCDAVVSFKTFLLCFILGPRSYPLLTVTFLIKERYIVHRDSKVLATKGNVASNWLQICGNGIQRCQYPHLWRIWISLLILPLKEEISSMIFSLKERVISYTIVFEPNRSRKKKDSQWWTANLECHYGKTTRGSITI